MNNPEINLNTAIVLTSLEYNLHKDFLLSAIDVIELKRKWLALYYKDGQKPSESFIKGAKTINFEAMFVWLKK